VKNLEGGDEGEPPREEEDPDDSDSDEGTIGQIFKEIRQGAFNASKKRRRFETGRKDFWKGRKLRCPGSKDVEEEKEKPYRGVLPTAGYQRPACSYIPPTRGSCFMGTTEALGRLTKSEKDDLDSDDEWIVIKVPKKMNGKFFFADFCDGDSEDEFQRLKGPYLQTSYTVADLLEIRAVQPRSARRRKGLTEFRDDKILDQRDNQGKILPPLRKCCKRELQMIEKELNKSFLPNLCSLCSQNTNEVVSDLSEDHTDDRGIDASPEAGKDIEHTKLGPKPPSSERRRTKGKRVHTALMSNKKKTGQSAPLHDMACLGVDTCSARSIS
jgi:hypothetical protein